MRRIAVCSLAVVASGLLSLSSIAFSSNARAAVDESTTRVLAVPGRSNSTVSVASHGSFVAVAWSASDPAGVTDIYLSTSKDAGKTFATPVRVNTTAGDARPGGGEQPPRVTFVPSSNAAPEVVVAWLAKDKISSIRVARSRDLRAFPSPVTVQSTAAMGDRGWHSLVTDSAGLVHTLWLDHRDMASPEGTHAGHDPAGTAAAKADSVAMAQRSGLYHATIGKGTPLVERRLANGVCYCCKTALAAGPNGLLYAAWRHVYKGNIRDIAFTVSRDGGKTFAAPTRVSDDRWVLDGCPDDGPAMTVEPTGRVDLVWPSFVDGAEPKVQLFFTSTSDGRTFAPRQPVATLGGPKPSHPQVARGSDGRLAIAWDESEGGTRRAAVRLVTVATNGRLTDGTLVRLNDATPAVYPAVAALPDGFIVAWTSGGPTDSRIAVKILD